MEAVHDYLERARSGFLEDALFGLLELEDDPTPALEGAYRVETDPSLRALIVQVVWQRRQPTSIDFLTYALNDFHPETWKQALDGLVALGTPEAKRALDSWIEGDPKKRAWIAEAIDQMSGLPDIDPKE